jgi:hypothetical protein
MYSLPSHIEIQMTTVKEETFKYQLNEVEQTSQIKKVRMPPPRVSHPINGSRDFR